MKTRGTALAMFASIFAFSTACSSSAGTVNAKGVAITLSLVAGENSKDSNSQSYSISLTGDSVDYAGPHPPCVRGRCAHGKVKFKLEKTVYEEALKAISRGDLTTAFSETVDLGGLGNYVKVTLTVTLDDKTGKTTVVGMTGSWEDGVKILSKQARDRAEAVRMLLIPFRLAGEKRLPKK